MPLTVLQPIILDLISRITNIYVMAYKIHLLIYMLKRSRQYFVFWVKSQKNAKPLRVSTMKYFYPAILCLFLLLLLSLLPRKGSSTLLRYIW